MAQVRSPVLAILAWETGHASDIAEAGDRFNMRDHAATHGLVRQESPQGQHVVGGWAGSDVPRSTEVTAGCSIVHFGKNCAQLVAPNSGAKSGKGRPSSTRIRRAFCRGWFR